MTPAEAVKLTAHFFAVWRNQTKDYDDLTSGIYARIFEPFPTEAADLALRTLMIAPPDEYVVSTAYLYQLLHECDAFVDPERGPAWLPLDTRKIFAEAARLRPVYQPKPALAAQRPTPALR